MKRQEVQFHSYPWDQIGMSDELHVQAAFTPRKDTRHALSGRLGGSHSLSGRFEK
jgi:hypothetical protein